jgi:adhesin transport system membrane fusion protein
MSRFDTLSVARRVKASRTMQTLVFVWGTLLAAVVITLIVTPWQQNVMGSGRVIAFSPLEREQMIQAPLAGRILRWYVQEGSVVKKGDPIADLSDNDPEYLTRLRQERETLVGQLNLAQNRAFSLELRIQDLDLAQRSAVEGADARLRGVVDKLNGVQQDIRADEAALATARLNRDRQQALGESGLTSTRNRELADLTFQKAETDLAKDRARLREVVNEQSALKAERERIAAAAREGVNNARASYQSALESVQKLKADLIKLDVQLARQSLQQVKAPRNGTILRLDTFAESQYIKAGDVLAVLVPDTEDRAVEIFVKGNDIPLITPGREVRLQFEGWPALQFVGWPSVAVGTFRGKVTLVDSTDDGKGKFRVVVTPSENWPEPRYLRQGVRANGWVLLNQVSLGYELWRQFNGFPPALPEESMPIEEKKDAQPIQRKAKK